MNILHAGTEPDLLTRLREMLRSADRADIAVGYFFVSGFGTVAEDIAGLKKTRVLVGRVDRPTLESAAAGLRQADVIRARLGRDGLVQRSERDRLAVDADARIADGVASMPQTAGSQSEVERLRGLVSSGLMEIRAYPREFMHAKAYLCWYDDHAEPGAAIVGSSNFTLAGFTGNTELNVRVTGDAEMSALRDWFEELWADSIDINDQVVETLNRSWALKVYPPYMVYLKALREMYDGEVGKMDLRTSTALDRLTPFQKDAVVRGLAMIEEHGGCYIGDVVGLGKTYIGAALLEQLRKRYPNDGHPLIVCPAGLIPMWKQFNEEFGLGAEVVSQSAIAPAPGLKYNEESGVYVDADGSGRGVVLGQRYPNRGPVLVDEAHNFRNVNNKRYDALRDYFDAGRHKTILLSATPQNLAPLDIYHQLRLFMDETEHGLDIEPRALYEYFRCADRWRRYREQVEVYESEYGDWAARGGTRTKTAPPDRPSEPNVPKADVSQILTHVFVRRRRKDIVDLYGDTVLLNGKPARFPNPKLSNVPYSLDKVYAKAGSFDDLQSSLRAHTAARYRATDFIKPDARKKREYRDLLRARNRIACLMRALLTKRLESSIEAFRVTLETLARSNRNFRGSFEKGFVPVGKTATRLLAGDVFDASDALAVLREEERRVQAGSDGASLAHPVEDFEGGKWLEEIERDYETLTEIQSRLEGITHEDDDKLRVLKEFLDNPDVKAGKVLIFSEAETTVEYLYSQLNPQGEDGRIARLTGSNRDRASSVIRRFSPTWNRGGSVDPEDEIQILLATDIVSEGQNLQDCARILNYDLHWNPVRLIQRFGRIDRLGSEYDEIHLHNMWPDTAVDAELDLTERLHNRIQSFHDLIGLDSKLLSNAERLNADAMYRIYEDRELPGLDDGLDEVAANQRSIALLQRIRDDDPELWQEIADLPDGIRSALRARRTSAPSDGAQSSPARTPQVSGAGRSLSDGPHAGETLALVSAGRVKRCYAVGSDLAPRAIGYSQFAATAACERDTPASALPPDTNERVMAAVGAFRLDLDRWLGASRRRSDNKNRRYLSRQLAIVRQQAEEAEKPRMDVLRRVFQRDLPRQAELALTEIRKTRVEGLSLVRRLEALQDRYSLTPPDDSPSNDAQEPRVIRVVCSDGLV